MVKLTESEIGVTVPNALTLLLPATVGLDTAKELVFTSRELSATEADDVGFVAGVCAEGELWEQVRDVARDIRENKSTAVLALNKSKSIDSLRSGTPWSTSASSTSK